MTNEWELLCGTSGDNSFSEMINTLTRTHDVKFIHIDRNEFGYIQYIIAKKEKFVDY